MSYFDFNDHIDPSKVNTIFELGSRDLIDAVHLLNTYKSAKIVSFECNPDCIQACHNLLTNIDAETKSRITFIEKAVSIDDGPVTFYPFDLSKYDNMGSSSMFKVDFSQRNPTDPDYNRDNPQKEITVEGTRLDTFMKTNGFDNIDLLCIDLQGYELNAIKSLGENIHKVKYIITECSVSSTYVGGATFSELNAYLNRRNIVYVASNKFGKNYPDLNLRGFSEFDALFINKSML